MWRLYPLLISVSPTLYSLFQRRRFAVAAQLLGFPRFSDACCFKSNTTRLISTAPRISRLYNVNGHGKSGRGRWERETLGNKSFYQGECVTAVCPCISLFVYFCGHRTQARVSTLKRQGRMEAILVISTYRSSWRWEWQLIWI